MGFPGGSDGKESICNVGDLGSIPGLGRSPGGGHGNLLWYSCLENPHGERGLVGYSLWGCKELDTTEQLSTAQRWVQRRMPSPERRAGKGAVLQREVCWFSVVAVTNTHKLGSLK